MSRYLGLALLGVCLTIPAAIVSVQQTYAAQAPQHQWSDQEDPHWRAYLKERHRNYHDWQKASKREQRDYWKWRDAHPDAH
jgi:hypothetical protein